MGGLEFTRNQKLALLAIIGLILIGASVKLARNTTSARDEGVVLSEPGSDGVEVATADSDRTKPPAGTGKVIFHVAGCVKSPGVYTLPAGSRVIDAIRAAGGETAGADLQSLNLAAPIEDGSKIVVTPLSSRSAAGSQSARTSRNDRPSSWQSSSGVEKLRNPGDGVVHINSADANELQRLPGVGPATAQSIIEYRDKVGRFSTVDQLDDVKGIGPKKLQKMRPFLAL